MSKKRFYSILLYLLTALLSFCSETVFSQEPFSADVARRRLDEAAENVTGAFSIAPEQVRVVHTDGPYATVEFTLCWESAVPLNDGKSVEFELLRLTIDYGAFIFSDERGNRWRPVAGGESNVSLLDREFSKTFRIKLKRENESTDGLTGDLSLRLAGSGRFSVLMGLVDADFLFPDIMAPVLESAGHESDTLESDATMVGSANYLARRTMDEAAVTIFCARRSDDGVRLTLGVEYAEPFDFFDSHEERLLRRPMSLYRAESVRGAAPIRPKSVRPLAMRPSGGTFELIFDLPADFEAWDFSIRLPVRLIEKEFFLPVVPIDAN